MSGIGEVSAGFTLGRQVLAPLVRFLRRETGPFISCSAEQPTESVFDLALRRSLTDEDRASARKGSRDFYEHLKNTDAIDFEVSYVRLRVRSLMPERMYIRDISLSATARAEPLSGTFIRSPSAGGRSAKLLLFDLDGNSPILAFEGEIDGPLRQLGDRPYFLMHDHELPPRGVEDFVVRARVSSALVCWVISVEIEYRGKRHLTTVRDGKDTFRTTGGDIRDFREGWMTGVAAATEEPLRPIEAGLDYVD